MRRRILQSTLLVVTITALVLGAPLAVTTWRLVEDITRGDLTSLLERVEARIEDEGTTIPDAELQLAVPSNGRLVLQQPGQQARRIGVGENPVSESLPFGLGGVITLEEPRSAMLTQQIQATLVVLLLVLLSVAAGTVVATVTARRLA